ncbi:MAG: hypothetical protein JSR41_20205 [Proteobacteria bacterium]|nr:hypothetical protein [Pseudomonadota bacterium]
MRPLPIARSGAAVGLALLLAACSREEASPASAAASGQPAAQKSAARSPSLRRQDLMPLAFPGWQDNDTARVGHPALPELGDDGRPVADSAKPTAARVTPREVVRLSDSRAVLLTETVPLDDQGHPLDAHVSGAWLGAYFFERQGESWVLSQRQDAVDYLGFMGSFGETAVHRVAPARLVLGATYGSCWQGYCGSWLSAWELRRDGVRRVLDGVALSASNTGAQEACEAVLAGGRRGRAAAGGPRDACFDIEGTPRFAQGVRDDTPGVLTLSFRGARTAEGRPAARARVRRVDEQAVYAWQDGRYVLSRGRNPVPGF